MTNLRLLYNLIYTLVVGLIFANPIFASILLLDVLAHVPSIRTYTHNNRHAPPLYLEAEVPTAANHDRLRHPAILLQHPDLLPVQERGESLLRPPR